MPNNSHFTPEQIQEILDLYFENFAHRQYIGARYVPIFGRKDEESIEWDNTGTYEPLTIVLYQGNSFTSRQFVPVGVDITNQTYWANTGNYNAQVEAYRQETERLSDTVTELQRTVDSIDASVLAFFTYNILSFDGVNNEGVECTNAIQTAINSLPDGCTVIFPFGTYRFESLELKNNIKYDFQGSELIFSGTKGIYMEGSLIGAQTMPNGYNKNSTTIDVGTTNYLKEGRLIQLINMSELFHSARNYYYKGGTFEIKEYNGTRVYIGESLPFDIQSSGLTAYIYEPKKCIIKNIGNIISENESEDQTFGIWLQFCKNVYIENVNIFTSTVYAGIQLNECYCTYISNVNCECFTTKYNNVYPIGIGSCNHTHIFNSNMKCEWHCISTGKEECCIDTVVEDSILVALGNVVSYDDHENAIYTTLRNCNLDGFVVANNATVENCVINTLNIDNSDRFVNQYFPGMSADYCNFYLKNCKFYSDDVLSYYNKITASYSPYPDATQTDVYFNSIVIENCSYSGKNTRFDFTIINEHIKGNVVIMRNSKGIRPKLDEANFTLDKLVFEDYIFDGTTDPIVLSNAVKQVSISDITVKYFDADNWVGIPADVIAIFNNIYYIPGSYNNKQKINVSGIAYMNNVDTSGVNSGRTINNAAGSKLYLANCKIQNPTIPKTPEINATNVIWTGTFVNIVCNNNQNYVGEFDSTDLIFKYHLAYA